MKGSSRKLAVYGLGFVALVGGFVGHASGLPWLIVVAVAIGSGLVLAMLLRIIDNQRRLATQLRRSGMAFDEGLAAFRAHEQELAADIEKVRASVERLKPELKLLRTTTRDFATFQLEERARAVKRHSRISARLRDLEDVALMTRENATVSRAIAEESGQSLDGARATLVGAIESERMRAADRHAELLGALAALSSESRGASLEASGPDSAPPG